MKELYKSKELDRDRTESIEADFEEVAASCGHFSFSLQDFANEMQTYLVILEELKEEMDDRKSRSWKWLQFWRSSTTRQIAGTNDASEVMSLIDQDPETGASQGIPELVLERRNSMSLKPTVQEQETRFISKLLKVERFLERDDGTCLPPRIYSYPVTKVVQYALP